MKKKLYKYPELPPVPSVFEQNLNNTSMGLGDRVERIAQPIARVIDRLAGTNIQGCGACQKRKEYLNKKFPST
jgi:hypothetical protein